MRSLSELELEIIRWAEARMIIPNAQPHTQLMKTVSELGELVDAEIKNDMAGIIDGVGDVLVTLVIYCDLRGITITQCLNAAYEEIRHRKGTLLANGLFVKEA